LIEILVVVGIIVILSATTLMSLIGRRGSQELDQATRKIAALLREAVSRSAAQEGGVIWGVRFSNSTTTAFYALFKNSYSASNVIGQYPLPMNVRYATSSIPSGGTIDITFAQISGAPSTSTSITLQRVAGSAVISTSTISVSQAGAVTF